MDDYKDFLEWGMISGKGVDATCETPDEVEFDSDGTYIRPDGLTVFRYVGPTSGLRFFMKLGPTYIYRIEPRLECFSVGKTVYVELNYDVVVDNPSVFKWVVASSNGPSATFNFAFFGHAGQLLPGAFPGPTPGHARFKTIHTFVHKGERKNFKHTFFRDYPFLWADVGKVLGKCYSPLKVECTQ